jgi:predicted TIM-barrel fold metal-dependent hydrolase
LKDLYLDTAASSASSLVCAHELTGAEKLLFGTDYPFAAADLQRTKKAVEAMPIPARERAGILGENARQLFSL